MAGIGTAPKDKSERRRRNVPARGEWVDLLPLDGPVLEALPDATPDGEPWRPSTRRAWDAWRQDPVSAVWSPSEVAHAWDTIELHQNMTASTANEIRLRMDGLGLTPKGKKDLRYRVTEGDEAPAKAAPRKAEGSARRARLSVVK